MKKIKLNKKLILNILNYLFKKIDLNDNIFSINNNEKDIILSICYKRKSYDIYLRLYKIEKSF